MSHLPNAVDDNDAASALLMCSTSATSLIHNDNSSTVVTPSSPQQLPQSITLNTPNVTNQTREAYILF